MNRTTATNSNYRIELPVAGKAMAKAIMFGAATFAVGSEMPILPIAKGTQGAYFTRLPSSGILTPPAPLRNPVNPALPTIAHNPLLMDNRDSIQKRVLVAVGGLGVAVAMLSPILGFWEETRPFAGLAAVGFLAWWAAGSALQDPDATDGG